MSSGGGDAKLFARVCLSHSILVFSTYHLRLIVLSYARPSYCIFVAPKILGIIWLGYSQGFLCLGLHDEGTFCCYVSTSVYAAIWVWISWLTL